VKKKVKERKNGQTMRKWIETSSLSETETRESMDNRCPRQYIFADEGYLQINLAIVLCRSDESFAIKSRNAPWSVNSRRDGDETVSDALGRSGANLPSCPKATGAVELFCSSFKSVLSSIHEYVVNGKKKGLW
jgi:hypothetical protein